MAKISVEEANSQITTLVVYANHLDAILNVRSPVSMQIDATGNTSDYSSRSTSPLSLEKLYSLFAGTVYP